MNQYVVTVPKYKSKSRNIMRILIKLDECFKYYNPLVAIDENNCSLEEIAEYLNTFHDLSDFKLNKIQSNIYISKKELNPDMRIELTFGDTDIELPFKDEEKEVESELKVTEDGCKVSKEVKTSNDKTRQVMCKINEELYSKDSWKELDAKGCCIVACGDLSAEDEVNLEYVKDNISHSSVKHKCVNIDIMRTENKTAVAVVLTWKN